MTYSIEARWDTNRTKRIQRVVEMSVLRTMARKIRRDHVRNSDIEQNSTYRWWDKESRGEENGITTWRGWPTIDFVLDEKPAGTCPSGRLPKRWRTSWKSTSQEIHTSRRRRRISIGLKISIDHRRKPFSTEYFKYWRWYSFV